MPNISVNKPDKEQMQARLKELAEEISSDLSALEAEQSKELLGDFVCDLFAAVTERQRREARRQKQAEGIAAAKARGVRFGRARKPAPDNFDEVRQAWKDGKLSLREAADTCGLSKGTFYGMVTRREEADSRADQEMYQVLRTGPEMM